MLFYNALATNESALLTKNDETRKKIALELSENPRKNIREGLVEARERAQQLAPDGEVHTAQVQKPARHGSRGLGVLAAAGRGVGRELGLGASSIVGKCATRLD